MMVHASEVNAVIPTCTCLVKKGSLSNSKSKLYRKTILRHLVHLEWKQVLATTLQSGNNQAIRASWNDTHTKKKKKKKLRQYPWYSSTVTSSGAAGNLKFNLRKTWLLRPANPTGSRMKYQRLSSMLVLGKAHCGCCTTHRQQSWLDQRYSKFLYQIETETEINSTSNTHAHIIGRDIWCRSTVFLTSKSWAVFESSVRKESVRTNEIRSPAFFPSYQTKPNHIISLRTWKELPNGRRALSLLVSQRLDPEGLRRLVRKDLKQRQRWPILPERFNPDTQVASHNRLRDRKSVV